MKFDIAILDSIGYATYEVTTYHSASHMAQTSEQILDSIKERVSVILSETDIMPVSFTFVGGSAFRKLSDINNNKPNKQTR